MAHLKLCLTQMSSENDHLKEVIKEKCQPWKERKIGVSWNFHCSEICISNVVWQLIILIRTRNGELAFRPYSTFLFQISQRLQTGSRKRTKNKFISSQSCEQGMYMQWTKGTNYIVKTPVTLLCTGYSKEKPLWNPGISHFSGDLK